MLCMLQELIFQVIADEVLTTHNGRSVKFDSLSKNRHSQRITTSFIADLAVWL